MWKKAAGRDAPEYSPIRPQGRAYGATNNNHHDDIEDATKSGTMQASTSSDSDNNPHEQFIESYPKLVPDQLERNPRQTEDDVAEDEEQIFQKIVYEKISFEDLVRKPKFWAGILALVVIAVLGICVTIYREKIIDGLKPFSAYVRSQWWGWIVPIIIMVIISMPPLFGHEIVAILCGAVYGLWAGFGIVAAGTFIGEILVYFVFKKFLRGKALAMERKHLTHAALARVTREGGFWIVFAVRLSVIPGHISTAVFATCGVAFWEYAVASFVTLPKQLVAVYVGVLIGHPADGAVINDVVIVITVVFTLVAMVYIWKKLRRMKRVMLAEAAEETHHGGVEPTA